MAQSKRTLARSSLMKKRKSNSIKKKRQTPTQKNASAASTGGFVASRRTIIKSSVAVGIAIAGGAWIHHYDTTNKRLHNLDVIGAGKSVVLQVHDPSCQSCRQLMRSTKTALKALPEIEYRIADLTTTKGSAIGEQYNVGKVTLLLFDSKGTHVRTVEGVIFKLHDIASAQHTPFPISSFNFFY